MTVNHGFAHHVYPKGTTGWAWYGGESADDQIAEWSGQLRDLVRAKGPVRTRDRARAGVVDGAVNLFGLHGLASILLNQLRVVRDGCRTCRQRLLESFGGDPALVAAMAMWVCSHVMDTYNDLSREMLERGDAGFRRMARAYSLSAYRYGFGVRELADIYAVARLMAPMDLYQAAERALDVLAAEHGDPLVFGSLFGNHVPCEGDEDAEMPSPVVTVVTAADIAARYA
ncbi:hypothetical protein P3T36_007198 [Kitasatospora sp. MAP12-15]|uniref:hypothetical protein n=1 Tax=unclassified Kitasatospora TaxID=2633591 RepID=UPI0024761BA3|nr:hypothetical protein [Kitasatospora sp. MAP12-44]MDH6115362.1 hypothetical protein [Kitasatospora sp. MAP12-44]